MDNYLLNLIKKTTEYIENNLLETLNLDTISEHVNFSKYHLLRIWKATTSTGLIEYVRRRRIALSLGDLINHRNSIEFLSSKYGFGSARSYNRAFKNEFAVTPANWRRNPIPLKVLDRYNADFMSCAGEGLIYFNSNTVLPAFSIAGHEYKVGIVQNMNSQTANQYGIDFFYNERQKVFNPVEKEIYIGFTKVLDDSDNYTIYQPSIQVNHNSIVPKDMTVKEIPPHKYFVFRYIGLHHPKEISSKTLRDIWQYIFEIWMPKSQVDIKEKFSFEYIDYAKCSKHYCECDLYFPISIL